MLVQFGRSLTLLSQTFQTYDDPALNEQLKQKQALLEVSQLCRDSDWEAVLDRVIRHPEVATAKLMMDNHIATTLLHKAITSKGNTILRANVISTVLRQTPHAARLTNGYGSLPLHVISQRNTKMASATKEALMNQLIQAYPDAVLQPGGVGKRTPLHVIFTDYVSPRLTKTVIEHGTRACFMPDKKGYLPAHVACSRHCSPEKLRMLLEVNPQALFHRTKEGSSLLDLAKATATKAHPNFALIKELERQMRAFGIESPTDGVKDAFVDSDVSAVEEEDIWTPGTIQDAAFVTFGDHGDGFLSGDPSMQKHGPACGEQHLQFGLDQGQQNYQHQQPYNMEQPRPLQTVSYSGSEQTTHGNHHHHHHSQYQPYSQTPHELHEYKKDGSCTNCKAPPPQQIDRLDPMHTPSPRAKFEPDYLDDQSFATPTTHPTYYGKPKQYTAPEPLFQPSFDYQHGTLVDSNVRSQNVFRKPNRSSAHEQNYSHEPQVDYVQEGQHPMQHDHHYHFNGTESKDCVQQQHPQDQYPLNEPHAAYLQKCEEMPGRAFQRPEHTQEQYPANETHTPQLQKYQKELPDCSFQKLHLQEQFPTSGPSHLQKFHKELPDRSLQKPQPAPHASYLQKNLKELPDDSFQQPQPQIGFKRTPEPMQLPGRYFEPPHHGTDGYATRSNPIQHQHHRDAVELCGFAAKQDTSIVNEPTKNPERASLQQEGHAPSKLQPDNYYTTFNSRNFFESVADDAQFPQAPAVKTESTVGEPNRKRKADDCAERPDAKKAAAVDPAVDLLMNFSRASAQATHGNTPTKKDENGV